MKPLLIALFTAALGLSFSANAALNVGDMAPDFSLPATDGKTYKLSDFRNKETVVLAWFPKAYTYGCTIECKSLAKNGHLIKKYRASYFMASVDPIETNQGFASQEHADFPLLSDPTRTAAKAYGVVSGTYDVAERWTYYIAPSGKILAIDKNVQPATSAEDMAAMLGKLGTPAR